MSEQIHPLVAEFQNLCTAYDEATPAVPRLSSRTAEVFLEPWFAAAAMRADGRSHADQALSASALIGDVVRLEALRHFAAGRNVQYELTTPNDVRVDLPPATYPVAEPRNASDTFMRVRLGRLSFGALRWLQAERGLPTTLIVNNGARLLRTVVDQPDARLHLVGENGERGVPVFTFLGQVYGGKGLFEP